MIKMDKKILSISVLLMIVIAATTLFVYFKNSDSADERGYSSDTEDVTDEEITNEIDDAFLSEDDEVEIGDMI